MHLTMPARHAASPVAVVTDHRYLDCATDGSGLTFGDRHPRLLAAAHRQLDRLTPSGRALLNDQLAADLATLTGKAAVLLVNTAEEARAAALGAACAWGGCGKAIVAGRDVPYGDAAALAAAIGDDTVAVLVEPVRGDIGVIVAPAGYLTAVRELCDRRRLLFIADESQSGLGRTGATFACDHEGVVPDLYVLGEALGGGIVPLAAVAADRDVLGLPPAARRGGPFACAVGRAVVRLLADGTCQWRARDLGRRLDERLRPLIGRGLTAVRVHGLWAGIDIDPAYGAGRTVREALMDAGVLTDEATGQTLRLAPPLVVSANDLDWAVDELGAVLEELARACPVDLCPGA